MCGKECSCVKPEDDKARAQVAELKMLMQELAKDLADCETQEDVQGVLRMYSLA